MLNPAALATVFGVIFLGELPDKTMFASLVLAAKGRAGLVWLGTAAAFAVHVVIAVTVGGLLITLLPHRWVEGIAAALFVGAAVFALRGDHDDDAGEGEPAARRFTGWRTVGTAFVVIFVAEWGDLTQILTANMAAKYANALWVGLAATAALWTAATVAMIGGGLLRRLPVTIVRRSTAIVLLALAGLAAYSAITGHATII
ncbi:MAG TPA: TMEM165/GDT1 family protein [Pseudonocardiaceae bacterium]|nr:TMEM165/GDT1 family protein [Pseudonocardiaceae bacterium]